MENINMDNFSEPQFESQIPQDKQEKNIYKPLFFIFFVLFLISSSSFATFLVTNNKNIKNISTNKDQDIQKITESTNPKSNTNNVLKTEDIQMEFPKEWQVVSYSNGEAKIITDRKYGDNYSVTLLLNININDSFAQSNYESKIGEAITTQFGEVFEVASGGPSGSTGAIVNGNKYSFTWNIETSEPQPENLDGVWAPYNLESEEYLNITKTVKPLK